MRNGPIETNVPYPSFGLIRQDRIIVPATSSEPTDQKAPTNVQYPPRERGHLTKFQ